MTPQNHLEKSSGPANLCKGTTLNILCKIKYILPKAQMINSYSPHFLSSMEYQTAGNKFQIRRIVANLKPNQKKCRVWIRGPIGLVHEKNERPRISCKCNIFTLEYQWAKFNTFALAESYLLSYGTAMRPALLALSLLTALSLCIPDKGHTQSHDYYILEYCFRSHSISSSVGFQDGSNFQIFSRWFSLKMVLQRFQPLDSFKIGPLTT
jgi:hypothetical protein